MSNFKLQKTYPSAFFLNKLKLIRLNEVIIKHYEKIRAGELSVSYQVKFNNRKVVTSDEIEGLFELDNGIKNRITELKIIYAKDSNLTVVNFGSEKRNPLINIFVDGRKRDWTNECFAEVEEQIERTKTTNWIENWMFELKRLNFTHVLQAIVIIIILCFTLFAFLKHFSLNQKDAYILQQEKVRNELIGKINNIQSQEEKLDVLLEVTRVYVLMDFKNNTDKEDINSSNIYLALINWKFYFVAIPILILIGILFYLVNYCYWMYAFIWGDMEEDFKKMIDRRKILWNFLIGSLILGVLSNLLVFGVTEML